MKSTWCSSSQTIYYLHRTKMNPLPPSSKRTERGLDQPSPIRPSTGRKGWQCTYPHTISSTHYSAYSESFFTLSSRPILLSTPFLSFFPFVLFSLLSVIVSDSLLYVFSSWISSFPYSTSSRLCTEYLCEKIRISFDNKNNIEYIFKHFFLIFNTTNFLLVHQSAFSSWKTCLYKKTKLRVCFIN